ncbi:MAG: LytTR family transcriptional regulator [Niastella sp.]|nr:LytTR family transcriptional regulator [Niastella sp.]
MSYLLSLFNKPYPLPESRGSQLKVATLLSVVVFLFLFLFKPFNQHEHTVQALTTGLVGGVTVFVVILFHFFVLFPLFPCFFREEGWTVGRELLWTLFIIITIALANMGVIAIWGSFSFSWRNVLLVTLDTAVVGMAPAAVSIIINQARLLRRYRKSANTLTQVLHQEATVAASVVDSAPAVAEPASITLTAENGKEPVTVLPGQLLAITSADNYCRLYIMSSGQLKAVILRSSLKRLEGLLDGHAQFWRCHRTAIVNLAAISEVSGTAQGYRLHVASMDETIPVSRSLNTELREKLQSIVP